MATTQNKQDQIQNLMQDRERVSDREAPLRTERIPRNEQNILTAFNLDKNYRYRWVLDIYGRINSFQLAGWEIVEGTVQTTYSGKGAQVEAQRGSQMWRTVNTRTDAPVKEAVLMRIPHDLYSEDQVQKQESIDFNEARLDPHGTIRQAQRMGPRATNISKRG